MKKKLLLLLLITTTAFSQNAQEIIDGLKKDLKNSPDAKKTATIYSDLTWYYSTVSIDSALHYGNKAVIASTKLGDSTLIAQVFSDVGAVYFRKGDFQNSKENYLKAYRIRKARNDYRGLAKINNNLASVYTHTQQYKAAMKSYLESLEYFESLNDKKNIAVTKANIGQLFTNLRDYPKAIKYLKESTEYAEKENLKERLCENYLNLAKAFELIGNYKSAILYNNKSLKNCIEIGNKIATGIAYQSLGVINAKISKDSLSKVQLQKSEKIGKEYNSTLNLANVKLSLVRNLIKKGKFVEANTILLEIKKIFEKANSKEDLLYTYKYMIPICAQLDKKDSVSYYTDKYSNLFEELLQKDAKNQTIELETKYQTTKKEKLLIEKESEAKQKNTLIVGISVLAFFIALIGFLIYRQQKLKASQQEKEFELKSAISKIENHNKLQEQRLNISRDLHDNIGAQLTFIISSVDNIKYAFDITNEKLDNKLSNISSFAKETILELRDTIWAMNSNEITFEDLEIRINNYIEKAKEAKDQISFSFAIDPELKTQKLTSVQGMNIYRTIQEAVNNSIKYANASIIAINAKKIENRIKISVQDNGIGFDLATVEKGNGLQNMQKRIEEIGGEFGLDSSSEGTSITVLLKKN